MVGGMTRPLAPWMTLALALVVAPPPALAAEHLRIERPRLVVLVVVDQLRADTLGRFADRLLPAEDPQGRPGGFRAVIDRGAYWPRATHDVYQAMTGPGHASISTGAWPARSGIALNRWWGADGFVYCVGDPGVSNLPDDGRGKDRAIGPANLDVPTLGDTLALSGVGGSVVSIALKDRAAVLLGGSQADAAIWFDSLALRWTTSTAWAEVTPPWVETLNSGPHAGQDLFATVEGNEAIVQAALAAIDQHALGEDARPDLLALGFSSLDYLGHAVGPQGAGMGAMVESIDRSIAAVLGGIADRLGSLDAVVVAVTSDHGLPPIPEELVSRGMPAGRIPEKALSAGLDQHLVDTLGTSPTGAWIAAMYRGNLWFDPVAVADPAIRAAAEQASAAWLRLHPGVSEVVTATDIAAGRLPAGPSGGALANQHRAGRSGDLVAGMRPFWFATDHDDGAAHMTRWSYDTTVPLAIAGAGIRPGRYATRATVIDLAPTLAYLLDILPPAAAEGRILAEAIGQASPPTPVDRRHRSRKGTP